MSKPLLSLSLDADNKWSYMKTHGDPGWEEYPSYLPRLAEVVLGKLAEHDLKITFFLVGKDAEQEPNRRAFQEIAGAGHEIGNHSLSHEPWWQHYDRGETENEIAAAEESLLEVTGRRTRGFRGPGFSLTQTALEVLAARHYLYDASTFPTFLGPLARAYYFCKSRGLSPEERKKRSELFGTMADGLRSIDPYTWNLAHGRLCEIPVTTMPLFRVPIHLSYLLYLATWSKSLAWAYRKMAFGLCRLTGTQPSFLLHPLDFLGGDLVQGLDFFPGMNLDTTTKLALVDDVFADLRRSFRIVTMEEHAEAVLARAAVPVRSYG